MKKQTTEGERSAASGTGSSAEAGYATSGAVAAAGGAAAEARRPGKLPPQDAWRETVESIVLAFILAFLFRTFIAEAFVIPTGSMAPTLFGRHKDVECPGCGWHYDIGASEELHDGDQCLMMRARQATCPNCRFTADVFAMNVFKGDRILVNKFPYEIGDPQRWDVCVFKYPEEPEKNYIKRLVGLPGEAIRINRGDVYARPDGAAAFGILRKADPHKQQAIQIPVYDDDHPPRALFQQGWPERWGSMRAGDAATVAAAGSRVPGWIDSPDGWRADPQRRTYAIDAQADGQWLRYRHFVPTPLDWQVAADGLKREFPPQPQLITDLYGYNSTIPSVNNDIDLYWVGDLTINGVVTIRSVAAGGVFVLELTEGVRAYRCEIDPSSGTARLLHTDDLAPAGPPVVLASAPTPVRGPGSYRFAFANVDDRLVLWINGQIIPFGDRAAYQAPAGLAGPQPSDLSPVGFTAKGVALELSELRLTRDIYYRAQGLSEGWVDGMLARGEYMDSSGSPALTQAFREALFNPDEYRRLYEQHCGPIEFAALGRDEYFVMGDNSPRSQDSRLWSNRRGRERRHSVPRHAFVGKAFVIYWPHGVPFLNRGQGFGIKNHTVCGGKGNPVCENYPEYVVPFYPQFGRWLSRIR